jgi:hypothetical protein
MPSLAQLPQGYINDNFTNQTDNSRIDCVLAVSSKSGKIEVMRGNDDMKSSLFRHRCQVVDAPNLCKVKAFLEKAQQEYNDEFNERTMINLDALRSPEFPVGDFEKFKKLLVMYWALKSAPGRQFMIEPSTVELAVAAANVPALNAAAVLYRTSVEDLRSKTYRKHANKASAYGLTRKDKKDSLTAIFHGIAEELKTRASQALDDEHEVTGAIKKGLGIDVNTAKYDTKAERAKRGNQNVTKEKRKEYDRKYYHKKKQEEYDEYLGGKSWGELYEETLKEMAEQKVRTVVYTK